MDTGEADEDEREQTDGEGNDEDQGVAADVSIAPRLGVRDTQSPKDAKRNSEVLSEKDYDTQPLKSAKRDKGLIHDVIGKSDTTNWLTETFRSIVNRYAELRQPEEKQSEAKQGAAKDQDSEVDEINFDVEAYIDSLAKSQEKEEEYSEAKLTEDRGTKVNGAELRQRLIEANRQTALHRKALREEEVSCAIGDSTLSKKIQLTEMQVEKIGANKKAAQERNAERKAKQAKAEESLDTACNESRGKMRRA